MKINKNNYEAYFIDYLEGKLDEKLVDDFIEFLQQNPELKEELSLFESISIEPENVLFNKKETLHKQKLDSEAEFNKAAIANLEGDISQTEKTEFESYINEHPEKKRDVSLYAKTKLHPDEAILFNKKKKLYHYSVGKTIFLWSGRVAAVLVLAFAFFTFFDKPVTQIIPDNKIALLEDKTNKKEVNSAAKKLPSEIKKSDTKKLQKNNSKPKSEKIKPQAKPKKSVRESTQGRLNHEDLALNRIPLEIPAELKRITASLNTQLPTASLATIKRYNTGIEQNIYEERLLANIVKEKTGIDKFQFNKITKAGLNLVSSISKDKFKYETNEDGKVSEYKYDSRLLAFSIPSKSERNSE
ncbi:MAG: hypothetical protein HN778_01525 [Prolixibacteraceae bacterium]|jgi:hypothetical protein|nr:hypothetical protein [Prolixibacteraceae bacterium]MBT6005714.1 hypothetical protein [Prolixibacteraceae bacterium]MBT6764497.1 hypothetical protein [Prolixibacteraceae bacterium]MBT7000541.1 hypothetical protein [Prolixibacteraceae bacterium]MBT7393489.1 hypothetical protein [Prolixibacteraceae bacterium]